MARDRCSLPAGQSVEIDLPGTAFYRLRDQAEAAPSASRWMRAPAPANQRRLHGIQRRGAYPENRRGILGIPYGLHTIRVTALERPVALLGAFSYDTRPNRSRERRAGWRIRER